MELVEKCKKPGFDMHVTKNNKFHLVNKKVNIQTTFIEL